MQVPTPVIPIRRTWWGQSGALQGSGRSQHWAGAATRGHERGDPGCTFSVLLREVSGFTRMDGGADAGGFGAASLFAGGSLASRVTELHMDGVLLSPALTVGAGEASWEKFGLIAASGGTLCDVGLACGYSWNGCGRRAAVRGRRREPVACTGVPAGPGLCRDPAVEQERLGAGESGIPHPQLLSRPQHGNSHTLLLSQFLAVHKVEI